MKRIGNYRIERQLAITGTSVHYEAVHLVMPRRAIVKVTHAAISWVRSFQVQALREPVILEALQHPGVVRVFESGVLAERRPWFAQELVEGANLAGVLARGKLLPRLSIELTRDLAEVLAYAHSRGIVHGGLRSDRVMLTSHTRGFPLCITDWSDARPHDAENSAPHVPLPGSRHYIAPEQSRGERIDDRADVYALGVIGYHALTGQLPFAAGAPIATLAEAGNTPVSVLERCPDAPRELALLVDQMLASHRDDRPSSADVLAELGALSDAMSEHGFLRKPRWTPGNAYTPPAAADDSGEWSEITPS